MELYQYILIACVGLFAGFINVLAGSGSMLVLPLLIFLGLPANVANATNRVAILLQNIVAVRNFRQQRMLSYRKSSSIAIASLVGAIIGAFAAVKINEQVLHYVIAVLLLVMFFLLVFKPSVWIKGKADEVVSKNIILQVIVFFFIGLYGGFIQAGVGFFLLAGLVLVSGFNLISANAAKVFIILVYTPLALGIFVWNGLVNWEVGLILGLGNMIGAYFASKYARYFGANFIRYLLMFALFISALKLFGFLDFCKKLFLI